MPPLEPRCQVCDSKERLLRCSACKVVSYCGQEHQAAHRAEHKKLCNEVKRSRKSLEQEEAKLRAEPDSMWLPQPVFEEGVGKFWGYTPTRPYMSARQWLVYMMLPAGTHEAVTLALAHTMDMIRLCRKDNQGNRSIFPAMLMRLGREQEAYDFVKWWVKISEDMHYDWGNMSLPHLDVKNANVFESVDMFCKDRADLYETFDVMLIKVKLLLDLRSLERAPEDDSQIFTNVVRKQKDQLRSEGLQTLIARLNDQIKRLYGSVKSKNKHLWPAFTSSPEDHASKNPPFFSPGGLEEAQLALRNSYQAWAETPGSEDVVRSLMRQDSDFPSFR